jgi:zinc transport system substrate-binding protein
MRIVLTTLVLAALGPAPGCAGGGGEAAPRERGRQVVAAFYPLAFAAEEVAEDVSVVNLTPAGAEPHDLELSVRDVERIRDADVVLLLGRGFQPAVEDAAAAARGEVVDLLAELDADGEDPHVWLDPERYGDLVERVAAALGDEAAALPLVERLRALDRAYERGLANCERDEIVVAHAAFGHLARAYGLEQIAIAGLSPEAEPSARALEAVAGLVEEAGVTTVFVEPLASPDEARTVARETGVRTATLNPVEGLTDEEAARGDDYFSLMEANLEALREALACR